VELQWRGLRKTRTQLSGKLKTSRVRPLQAPVSRWKNGWNAVLQAGSAKAERTSRWLSALASAKVAAPVCRNYTDGSSVRDSVSALAKAAAELERNAALESSALNTRFQLHWTDRLDALVNSSGANSGCPQ